MEVFVYKMSTVTDDVAAVGLVLDCEGCLGAMYDQGLKCDMLRLARPSIKKALECNRLAATRSLPAFSAREGCVSAGVLLPIICAT